MLPTLSCQVPVSALYQCSGDTFPSVVELSGVQGGITVELDEELDELDEELDELELDWRLVEELEELELELEWELELDELELE